MPEPRPSLLDRALRVVTEVHPGEGSTAILLAVNVFLYLSATQVAKVLREPLIAAGGGSTLTSGQLRSYTNTVAALLLLAVVPLYGRLASSVPRRRLMNIVTPIFIVCFGLFFLLAGAGAPIGIPFYAFLAVFNVMILAQFWAFANDVYTEEAGKRLFPVVGVGGSAGAVAGSLLAGKLIEPMGINGLFVVTAALLLLATLLTNVVDTRERRREEERAADGLTSGLLPAATAQYTHATGEYRVVGDRYREASGFQPVVRREAPPPEPTPASTGGAFRLVRRNPYLLLIALLVVLLNWVNSNGEFILNDTVVRAAEAAAAADPTVRDMPVSDDQLAKLTDAFLAAEGRAPTAAERTQLADDYRIDEARGRRIAAFYATFYGGVNVLVLVMQILLVSRIIGYFGVGGALMVLPVIALGGYVLLAFFPVLGAIRWAKTLENGTDYSLNNTVRQTLFLPTTREEKYKAKQVTDSFAQRTGDVLHALTVFVGTGLLALGAARLAILNIALVLVWLAVALQIGRYYKRLAAATRL